MNKKTIYIIVITAAIILIAAIFFIVNFLKKPVIENLPIINETPRKDLILERQNDINYFNQAQESSNLDLCTQIGDVAYKNSCVHEIALKAMASSSCAYISNEDSRSYCSSLIALNKALASKIIDDCLLVEQSMLEKKCVEQLAENTAISTCETLLNINLKNTCLSIVYYKQAKLENNPKTCNQIPELIQRANCLSEIQNIDLHSDLDKDNLDYLQEILSNTNPNNHDTDGDGFKDGDEIISGYNPDGAGPITPGKSSNIISCQDIKDELIKSICSREFKDNSFDLFKCSEIKDNKLKDYCESELKVVSPSNK